MRTLSKAVEPSLRSNLTNINTVNLADDDYEQAVLSLPVSEAHIAGVFKCESKHAETSKSLFNVTKIDVQCNHFDDK